MYTRYGSTLQPPHPPCGVLLIFQTHLSRFLPPRSYWHPKPALRPRRSASSSGKRRMFFLPRLPSLLLDYRRRRTRCPLRLSRRRSKNNTAHKNSLFKFLGSNSCPRDFPLPSLPPLRAGRQHRSKKLIKACNQMRFSACRGEEGENDLTTSRHVVSSGL